MLSRHGFLRDQEGNTGFKIHPPLLKNLRCAGVSNFDQLTHGEVDLPPLSNSAALTTVSWNRGQERGVEVHRCAAPLLHPFRILGPSQPQSQSPTAGHRRLPSKRHHQRSVARRLLPPINTAIQFLNSLAAKKPQRMAGRGRIENDIVEARHIAIQQSYELVEGGYLGVQAPESCSRTVDFSSAVTAGPNCLSTRVR